MSNSLILAIDQGTSSTRTILYDSSGKTLNVAQMEHEMIYPQPGWVEHNPLEILENTTSLIKKVLEYDGDLCSEDCDCRKSLELAVWTKPEAMNENQRQQLEVLFE